MKKLKESLLADQKEAKHRDSDQDVRISVHLIQDGKEIPIQPIRKKSPRIKSEAKLQSIHSQTRSEYYKSIARLVRNVLIAIGIEAGLLYLSYLLLTYFFAEEASRAELISDWNSVNTSNSSNITTCDLAYPWPDAGCIQVKSGLDYGAIQPYGVPAISSCFSPLTAICSTCSIAMQVYNATVSIAPVPKNCNFLGGEGPAALLAFFSMVAFCCCLPMMKKKISAQYNQVTRSLHDNNAGLFNHLPVELLSAHTDFDKQVKHILEQITQRSTLLKQYLPEDLAKIVTAYLWESEDEEQPTPAATVSLR